MRKSFLLVIVIFIFSSCYGPVRFATKKENQTNGYYVDSTRITRALNASQDSSLRFATDLEFTEEEIQEILTEESRPIENPDALLLYRKLVDTLSSVPTSYERLLMTVINYLGTPYKFGGNSRKGIDCSAFTRTIFMETFNIDLPRSTLGQIKIGIPVQRNEMKFGDLVFFNTRRRQNPGHVGIYLWDDYFVHASTKYGVIVSSMSNGYYDKRFVGARRIEEVYALTNVE